MKIPARVLLSLNRLYFLFALATSGMSIYLYSGAAARPVTKYPAHLSRKSHSALVSTAFSIIDASSKGLLALVSPDRTCPEMLLRTLTPTLTTAAFDRSSLEWFEACSWKPASKGLPSSLTQLVHAQVRFSF